MGPTLRTGLTPSSPSWLTRIGEGAYDVLAGSVGILELTGFRYPVKPYEAKVMVKDAGGRDVWTGVTRGSRRNLTQMQALRAEGYRSVLSLCLERDGDATNAPAAGLRAKRVPILDNSHPTFDQVKQALDFMTAPQNLPLFIHCEQGKGRTGLIMACYRMAVNGFTLNEALAEFASYGGHLPNQRHFIERFAQALAAGQIKGYPLKSAISRSR